jgi:hypothetical protein
MKSSAAANVAILLVAVGWVLAFYGAMSQIGDPMAMRSSNTFERQDQSSREEVRE